MTMATKGGSGTGSDSVTVEQQTAPAPAASEATEAVEAAPIEAAAAPQQAQTPAPAEASQTAAPEPPESAQAALDRYDSLNGQVAVDPLSDDTPLSHGMALRADDHTTVMHAASVIQRDLPAPENCTGWAVVGTGPSEDFTQRVAVLRAQAAE